MFLQGDKENFMLKMWTVGRRAFLHTGMSGEAIGSHRSLYFVFLSLMVLVKYLVLELMQANGNLALKMKCNFLCRRGATRILCLDL